MLHARRNARTRGQRDDAAAMAMFL